MITQQEALTIAANRCKELNRMQEYEDAYRFYYYDGNEYIGGWQCGFVVLKETGEIIMPYEYYLSGDYEAKEVGEEIEYHVEVEEE